MKDLDETKAWFYFTGEKLSTQLTAIVNECEDETTLFWALFDFYNHLMAQARLTVANGLLSQASKTVEAFRSMGRPYFEAMFLEAVSRIAIQLGNLPAGLLAMEQMAESATPDQLNDIEELATDIRNNFHDSLRLELSGLVLASLSRVYASLNKSEKQVQAMLQAAGLYARNGASKPAYDILRDAMEVAQNSGSKELVASVLSETIPVAYDCRDLDAAFTAANKAIKIWRELGRQPPYRLLANQATVLMRTNQLEEATKIFTELLATGKCEHRFSILSNMAAICRRQERFKEANLYIAEARSLQKNGSVGDPDLELELIAAKVAKDCGDMDTLLRSLSSTCDILEAGLTCIFKLHHRRGFRQRYLSRIEGLMAGLPTEGSSKEIMPIFATVHGGIIGDWIAMLAWADQLDPTIDTTNNVQVALKLLRHYGSPFLHARVEATDDAWLQSPEGKAWDSLGFAVDAAVERGAQSPHCIFDLDSHTRILNKLCDEGWVLLMPTFANDKIYIWIIIEEKYKRVELAFKHLRDFLIARNKYASKNITRAEFSTALNKYLDKLSALLSPELVKLSRDCPGIYVLQDLFDSLPLTAVFLNLDELRGRMTLGDFEIRTAPVIFEGKKEDIVQTPSIVTIIDSSDSLKFTASEGPAFARAFHQNTFVSHEATDEKAIMSSMAEADILIVSTHGWSITNYSDPSFASLGVSNKMHAIRVATIQKNFPDFPYRLVLLNACYAGATALPNVEAGLRTHDTASYPALLLMNQSGIVSAPGWPVFDVVSLLYSSLVGEGLSEGLSTGRSLCSAIARLRDMTRGEIVARIRKLPDSDDRANRLKSFRDGDPEDRLFLDPYICGGFSFYSLM